MKKIISVLLMVLFFIFSGIVHADMLFDDFNDGDFSNTPTWTEVNNDDHPRTVEIKDNALHFLTTGAGGNGGGVGIEIETDIVVTNDTSVTFDGKAVSRSVGAGCGWSCGEFPVNVQIYLVDESGKELKVRYALNYGDAIENKNQDEFKQICLSVPQNEWVKNIKYSIKDAWPNAVKITKIYLFAAGWDFDGYIDNIKILGKSTSNFKITSEKYAYKTDNMSSFCKSEFGENYRMADWNDIVDYYNETNSVMDVLVEAGSAFVSRNGEEFYSNTRRYFATFHNHNKPGNYLAHDNIDSYLISLGSWDSNKPIMCYTKSNDSDCEFTQVDLDEQYEAGKQFCINNLSACGIEVTGGFTQADLDQAYQEGKDHCKSDPSACGITVPGECAVLMDNLDISVPCIDVFGNNLPIYLEKSVKKEDPFGFYWRLNLE